MLVGTKDDLLLTERILGCAIEVHRELGPGLLETAYEAALCCEFRGQGISFVRQVGVPLYYKGELISEHRPDLIVEERVVVEVKSITRFEPVHVAQILTYLRVLELRTGLLLNFNTAVLRHGIRRVLR
jgi:GxxExxY protein